MRGAALILVALCLVFAAGSATATPANNPITNGLIAAWEFTGNANDVSGNGNDGVLNGEPTLAADRFGNPDSAYSFDGSNDYINSSDTFTPQPEGAVSFWFNHAPNPDGGGIISSRSDYGYLTGDLIIQLFSDSFEVYYWNGAGGWGGPGGISPPSSGEWHHLLLNWSSSTGSTTYLDGDPVGSAAVPVPIFGNLDIEIGRQGNQGLYHFFDGSIDDVYIYDRALSASEVSTLYSAVPEPSTALLLGVGMAGLGMRRRRRGL